MAKIQSESFQLLRSVCRFCRGIQTARGGLAVVSWTCPLQDVAVSPGVGYSNRCDRLSGSLSGCLCKQVEQDPTGLVSCCCCSADNLSPLSPGLSTNRIPWWMHSCRVMLAAVVRQKSPFMHLHRPVRPPKVQKATGAWYFYAVQTAAGFGVGTCGSGRVGW